MYYLNCFFVFSVLGFLIETLFSAILGHNFSSGILHGPWTPIYGLGSILIIIISKKLFINLHMKRIYETIIVFFVITIVLTILEWIGGELIELIFKTVYWSYENMPLNIGKYISVEMSLLWGIMSIIFIYLIKPKADFIIKKIPRVITCLMSILFIIDVIYTFCKGI